MLHGISLRYVEVSDYDPARVFANGNLRVYSIYIVAQSTGGFRSVRHSNKLQQATCVDEDALCKDSNTHTHGSKVHSNGEQTVTMKFRMRGYDSAYQTWEMGWHNRVVNGRQRN